MSNLDIQRVLQQMHVLQDQMRGTAIRSDKPVDFGALIKNSIDQVNAAQQSADRMTTAFETGEPGVNLAEVMISTQKAGLSFQAMVQVRNKLVDAYKEIMNMPM